MQSQYQQYENQQYEQQLTRGYQPDQHRGYLATEQPAGETRHIDHPLMEWPAGTTYDGQAQPHPPSLPQTEGNFFAALSYSLGWFSGLIFLLFSNNRYVRFHALQALLFFGGINLLDAIIISAIGVLHPFWPFPNFILFLAFMGVNFIAFIGWVVGMFQAYRGTYYRMPLVGTIATNLVPPHGIVKP
ncbi:MAG: hypothetical protein J2P37_03765 [Ktedonobacteraceae bacterium]|nr:hypothetical protein [Ktedonobacteraceae bacterium]